MYGILNSLENRAISGRPSSAAMFVKIIVFFNFVAIIVTFSVI
jgi:hypothetical protein